MGTAHTQARGTWWGWHTGTQRSFSHPYLIPWGEKVEEHCRRWDSQQTSPSSWCLSCLAAPLELFV